MVIETTDNRFFNVTHLSDPNLAHVYIGFEVKKVRGAFVPKKNARPIAVRKAGSRIVTGA